MISKRIPALTSLLFLFVSFVVEAGAESLPIPQFTEKEWTILKKGDHIKKDEVYTDSDGFRSGKGVAYIIANTSPEKIWEQILDYNNYAEFYPHVENCHIYKREGNEIFAQFNLSVVGIIKIQYHVHHTYCPDESRLTWKLDKSKENDIKETVGFWNVWPLEGGRSLIGYSVVVQSGRNYPKVIENIATGYGLRKTVECMKLRAESGGTYKK